MAIAERNRSTLFLIFIAGLVVVILGIYAVRAFTHEEVPVRVAPVTFQTLSSTVSTNGQVVPVTEYQAHAPFPGVIQKIFVQVGQHVAAGTLLIKMDDADARARLAAAQANLSNTLIGLRDVQQGGSVDDRNRFTSDLAAARVEQQQAAANVAVLTALNAKGSASAAEVASAQQRLTAAELSLKSANLRATGRYNTGDATNAAARVNDARANLAAARSGFNNVVIRTPLAGTVYSIPIAVYDFVPSGDSLLNVADLNHMQVRAYFDEPEIGKLAPGQSVKIDWPAKPGSIWHGHIERAPTTVITYGTRNVGECIITVDDARGDLLPNTNVTVTVTEMERPNALSIPREALHTEGSINFVFRIVAGRLARTPVQIGVVNLTSVEITGGLSDKDIVVLNAAASGKDLTNGLEVKPVE